MNNTANKGLIYFPSKFEWVYKRPQELGMDAGLLSQAVEIAIKSDTPGPHDMTEFLKKKFWKRAI